MDVSEGTLSCTHDVRVTEIVPSHDQSTEYTSKYKTFAMDCPGFNHNGAVDWLTDRKIQKKMWKGLHDKYVLPMLRATMLES